MTEAFYRLVPSEQVYGQDDSPRTGTPQVFYGTHLSVLEECSPEGDLHMLDLYRTDAGQFVVRREQNMGFADRMTVDVYKTMTDLVIAAISDDLLRRLLSRANIPVVQFHA